MARDALAKTLAIAQVQQQKRVWLICVWVVDGEAWGSCRDLGEVQLLQLVI